MAIAQSVPAMDNRVALLKTLDDPAVFGPFVGGASWAGWRTFLSAVFGVVPPEHSARALILQATQRKTCPTRPARESYVIVGRRGGKSFIAALLAVLLACFREYDLAPGERGLGMIIASDRRQARVVKRYVSAILQAVPLLRALVAQDTKENIELTNGITIEIHTASFRSIRGYTVVFGIADELAFWSADDSANPDSEIFNALRPAMATVPDALLLGISTPYARRGELWRAYQTHFGQDGDVLVWQADTRTMNPLVPSDVIDRAYAEDPVAASGEYGALFRSDLESFVAREVLQSVTVLDRHELPPMAGVSYKAFVDPSGGSSDSMTLAIAHREGDRTVLDAVRERLARFDPETVVAEFATLLAHYHVTTVTGDRYAGEWPVARFRAHGITYRSSDKTKSELYAAFLPKLNAGQVELLDLPRLLHQLGTLERRTARGGRESIDHPPRQHDDVANACAGVVQQVVRASEHGTMAVNIGPQDRVRSGSSSVMQAMRKRHSAELQRRLEESETGGIH